MASQRLLATRGELKPILPLRRARKFLSIRSTVVSRRLKFIQPYNRGTYRIVGVSVYFLKTWGGKDPAPVKDKEEKTRFVSAR